MQLPQIIETTIADNSPLVDAIAFEAGSDVVVDSATTDATNTPTWWVREGLVCVLDTATGRHFPADGATGDRNAPAKVTSLGTGDVTWNNAVVTTTDRGGTATTVALGGATATAAAAVTDLNNNAVFAARYKASVVNTKVQIATLAGGADEYLTASCTADTFFGAAVTASGGGSDADYRVTLDAVVLQDQNGAAVNATASTARRGHFSSTRCRSLTAEAKAVLVKRGSFFD